MKDTPREETQPLVDNIDADVDVDYDIEVDVITGASFLENVMNVKKVNDSRFPCSFKDTPAPGEPGGLAT